LFPLQRRASGIASSVWPAAARRGLSWLDSRRCAAVRESVDEIREGGGRIPACRRARLARRASGGLPRRLFAAIVAWKPPVLAARDEL